MLFERRNLFLAFSHSECFSPVATDQVPVCPSRITIDDIAVQYITQVTKSRKKMDNYYDTIKNA